jgi:alkanesulfonate monooxygenase SsuD/methylene tetrahydromethanopterin reductase-like flavin-dependent oxidoreductase (luciferase family)
MDVLRAELDGLAIAAGPGRVHRPEIYSDPFMGLGCCAAVTHRVQLATGIKMNVC